ncbi:MAG TPA: 2-C-methyl-D-erythritol 4-phosphate cytidylyltransferase [Candidatus Binataceae bacterium]|nr:2-C-methyl-D-erythritol 4-phosphate cytidylyltransferase [Candidatus Binataceae bacterium]
MRASAIIVAAGSGSRLGRAEPKAFVELAGHTILHYSLAAAAQTAEVVEIVVTVPAGKEKLARAEANSAASDLPVKITAGGAARQDSVRIALALTSAESDLVIVHDAARPLANPDLFAACLAAAQRCGGAIAAIPVADTLKRVERDAITETIVRAGLWQAQTPQAFRRAMLVAAHERALRERIAATDDADLVERMGTRVEVVQSALPNFKITTAADLAMAELILAARASARSRRGQA